MTALPSGADGAEAVAAAALTGRREAALLSEPTVARMARLLAIRCREPVWVRTCVVTLDRFRALVAPEGLAGLITAARHDPAVAEDALVTYCRRLPPCTDTQLSALAVGPKVWFRTSAVPVAWRPAPGPVAITRDTGRGRRPAEDPARLLILAMINSGLSAEEVLGLRMGDVGSLDEEARLQPDRYADPLAVSFRPEGTDAPAERRLTFLNFEARVALSLSWAARVLAGEQLTDDAPLIGAPGGGALDAGVLQAARARHEALIGAGNEVNVFMCRMTGDFFRTWGMPGSRFQTRDAAQTDQEEELSSP